MVTCHSGAIYSKSAFRDAIPFIISPHFEIGEQELESTAGQDVEPTLADMRRLQALCCQKWRSAIRKVDFEGACRIMESKRDSSKQDATASKQTNRKVSTFKQRLSHFCKKSTWTPVRGPQMRLSLARSRPPQCGVTGSLQVITAQVL